MARKKKDVELAGSSELSRAHAVEHYQAERKAAGRRRGLRVVLITLLLTLLVGGGVAFAFIMDLNNRLAQGVTQELRDVLVSYDAGEPFYMLLLGVDKNHDRVNDPEYGADDSAYRSDTIILARIDPANHKVTLVSIHRDTIVEMEGYEQKINAAYSIGGPAYVTRVVSEFAGVPISHYAEVDFDSFCMIVDQIGGITVNVPVDVYDPNYTGADIKAGEQHLDGDHALQLCRARHAYDAYGDGDVYRAANQRAVIGAIVKKVIQSDPATMATTISTMADSVTTDMDAATIIALATEMRSIDVDNDFYSAINPTTSEYVNDTWYERNDDAAWHAMMRRVDAGLPPYEDADDDYTTGISATGTGGPNTATAPETELEPEPETPTGPISVRVLNGTYISGLAGQLATELTDYGYETSSDNAPSSNYTTTLIVYNGDIYAAEAQKVADIIGGEVIANDGSYSTEANIVVYAGADQG